MAADPKTGLSEMWRYKYVALLDEGFRAIVRKDYNLALDRFSRQFDVFPPISNSMARYYIYTHFKSGDLLKKLGQLGKAEEQFRQAYDLSLDYGVKDYRLLICDALSGLYAQTGRQDKSLEFRTLYLNLKDSLLSYRQTGERKRDECVYGYERNRPRDFIHEKEDRFSAQSYRLDSRGGFGRDGNPDF